MTEPQNTPLSRSERVELTPALAEVLKSNTAMIQQLQKAIRELPAQLRTAVVMDQQVVAALAKDAGFDLNQFQSWDYADEDGKTFLVLTPAPLPMPEQPKEARPISDAE